MAQKLSLNQLLSLLRQVEAARQRLARLSQIEGRKFRANLTERDLSDLQRARRLFLAGIALPPLLYYSGASERPTKFPATISFTIRKGLPSYVGFALWLGGWYNMGRTFHRPRCPAFVRRFSTQMFATGVWLHVFRLGMGSLGYDAAHFLGAIFYMLDHLVLHEVLGMRQGYRHTFRGAFGLMVAAGLSLATLEKRSGIMPEHKLTARSHTALRAKQVAALPRSTRRLILLLELLVMGCENALFVSFVGGMLSGVEGANEPRLSHRDHERGLQGLDSGNVGADERD
jgi:hypothetical protein